MRERTDDPVPSADSEQQHYLLSTEEVSLPIMDLLPVTCLHGIAP